MTATAGDAIAPRDLREGGSWTRPQATKNALIRWLVRVALAATDRVPAPFLLALGRALGRSVRVLSPRLRRVARSNARRALPEDAADAAASACFERVGENLALSLLLRRKETRAEDWVRVAPDSESALRSAIAEGRGVVFVSAHLGPFELVPAAVRELGLEAAIVVRESYDPSLDPLVDAHRRGRGISVIHRGRPGAALRIVRKLREGAPVGFLPDLGGRVPSLSLPFLGVPFPFPIGPQQIALRARCPLVLGTLQRVTSALPRFELLIERVETTGTLEAVSLRLARGIEARITRRGSEGDYVWMAPRRPDCGVTARKGSLVGHLEEDPEDTQ